eukprot:RCo038943
MSRPEVCAPPEVFYNSSEATKYMANSRMQKVQSQMAARALELLNLPPDCPSLLLLDIGCGTGLSGSVLEQNGHRWVGIDISQDMLDVAVQRETDGELLLRDMGLGLPFRPGIFDGAISVSALQWLCNADRREHIPQRRLKLFFMSLFSCLARGARAVFQFYPENKAQLDLIVRQSERAGFTGGLVVDFPHSTRAKKYFLVLFAGPSSAFQAPKAMTSQEDMMKLDREMEDSEDDSDDEEEEEGSELSTASEDEDVSELVAKSQKKKPEGATEISCLGKRPVHLTARQKRGAARGKSSKHKTKKHPLSHKEWIMWKKEQARARGKKHALDSKYTGRSRRKAL